MSAAFGLLAAPLLWATHFICVYVFVSLACLWRWHRIAVLDGVSVVPLAVGSATVLFALAIAGCGAVAARRSGFEGRVGLGVAGLFCAATLMVGLPTLMAPACR